MVRHVSAMVTRHPPTVKLNALIPKAHLGRYLGEIDWPGSISELEQKLAPYDDFTDMIRLDWTIGPSMYPKIGIEFFSKDLPDQDDLRVRLLEQLVGDGACTAENSAALRQWAGFSSIQYADQPWPVRLGRTWYTKLVYEPEQPLSAKAYLGFAPNLFSIFALQS